MLHGRREEVIDFCRRLGREDAYLARSRLRLGTPARGDTWQFDGRRRRGVRAAREPNGTASRKAIFDGEESTKWEATAATPEAAADRREPDPRPTAEPRPAKAQGTPRRANRRGSGQPGGAAESAGGHRKTTTSPRHDSIFLDQADAATARPSSMRKCPTNTRRSSRLSKPIGAS